MQELFAALATGGVVVASSPRAARALRRLHARRQRERGLTAWRSPAIFYWEAWLQELWRQRVRGGDETRLVLSSLQEHHLWARLIRQEVEERSLVSTDGIAELVQQGYELLCDYNCLDALQSQWPGVDATAFRGWASAFEAECQKQDWLSRAKLPLVLAQALSRSVTVTELPAHLFLAGFDRIAPGQECLLSALAAKGCTIGRLESVSRRSGIEAPLEAAIEALVEASNEEDEISVCAWWVRRTLELAAAENKTARIGVLVPGLSRQRGEIERIFRQVLAPESVAVTAPTRALPFEFSLGVPLDRAPLARAALLLLRWMAEPLSRDDLSWLVLSGFLCREESDWLSVSPFDAGLKPPGVLPRQCSLDIYLVQQGWHGSPALSGLRDRLAAARREWHRAEATARDFAEWAEAARRMLPAAGWPGAHRMSSEDFQLKARWDELLDRIATLSFDGHPASYTEFLRVLRRQMAETIFAPQSHDAPVQILGPFEAAGLEFDAIWFLGASEQGWPAPARPHPLLPAALQRERGMPHATADADWELARLVTARIQRSAPRCIFSYPAQEKDGPLRPSTVLMPRPRILPSARMREILAAPSLEEQAASEVLELQEDRMSGLAWPREQVAGGYGVLKAQAACPFQAFAHYRLGARPLERADWGLDPKDRGTLLHRALEGIWSELKDQDALIAAIQAGSLKERIEWWTNEALSRYCSTRLTRHDQPAQADENKRWSEAYLQAERQRIAALLQEWLAYEAKRAPFSVEGRETPIAASAGDLKLKLRTDRIDRIASGHLLIDYKTGKVSTAAWESSRPDEPQLPLYAIFGNVKELRGVLLAQLRAQDLKFTGCVDEAGLSALPGLSQSAVFTPELRAQWEAALLGLAEDFLNGEAAVDPKKYPDTCRYCALPGLCRVAESERARAALDEEDDGLEEQERGDAE